MKTTHSFGYWVRRQRLALDLTQAALARQVGCAPITIRKIEADERRPSRQTAARLAEKLAIPEGERERFIAAAVGESPVDRMPLAQEPLRQPEARPAWLEAGTQPEARPRFVGRDPELARLNAHMERALAGDGGLVFVSGEAGQGKTALLAEFARQAQEAHEGLIVAQGYCAAAAGMGQPYLPFRDVLVSLSGDLEGRWQAGLLGREQAERLWRFAPAVARTIEATGPQLVGVLVPEQSLQGRLAAGKPSGWRPRPDPGSRPASEGQQSQLFEQLAEVLHALAEQQPLLLLIDDLQWVDAASASLLFHLGRRLAGSRILLAGAYRPSQLAVEPGSAAGQTLQQAMLESARLFGDNRIDLQHLDPSEARRLSDALLDREPNGLGEGFRVKLFWQTRGNPLFVIELLREMRAQGQLIRDEGRRWVQSDGIDWEAMPGRVTAVIEQRLARLEHEARWVLDVASVEGERFTVAVAAAITGLDEGRLLRMLSHELQEQHGLVEELGELKISEQRLARFQFSHVLFQHYLYEALGEAERRRLHGEIADRLAQLHRADLEAVLPQLADHYDAAGREKLAIECLTQAGDRARTQYAAEEASGYFRRAAALLRKTGNREQLARTLMKLGLTHQTAFDYARAQQAFDEAFLLWSQAMPAASGPAAATRPLRLIWRDPPSLDPTLGGYNVMAPVANQIFSGLVAFGPESEIVPDVAHSWEMADGGRRLVFHLRDDVFWSDGEPVTAYDFEFAYRRALDPATGAGVAPQLLMAVRGAAEIHEGRSGDVTALGVTARNAQTLVFELQEPTSYFLYNLAYYVLLPVPRHVVERHGPAWASPEHIVTNGPFRLAAWEPGRFMHLQRNSGYHGHFSGNVEQVHLTLDHPLSAQVELYAAGQLDVVIDWYTTMEQMIGLRRRFPEEYVLRPAFMTFYYFMLALRPPFDDQRVRRALAMAVDRPLLAATMEDLFAPATGGFVPPGMPGHVPDCALPFDPEGARRLLVEAGYSGRRAFPPLTVLAKYTARPLGRFLQQGWQAHLDLDVALKEIKPGSTPDEHRAIPQAIMVAGWIADYPDPDNFLRVNVLDDVAWWRDETYVDLLTRAARTLDQRERLGLYGQAERILAEAAPLVPLGYMPHHLMLKPWVKRYPTSAVKNPGFWKDVVIE
jgi:ABC-type oligopeptide transport system substrate-binding subunit/transcriptional regulator with XRE-family HTH domain